MIPVLIKTVLRSVFVGLTDAVCLRAFADRDGLAQRAGLGPVLVGALAMPSLIPIVERSHSPSANSSIGRNAYPMTLLQELQEILQARSGSGLRPRPFVAPVPTPNSPHPEKSSPPAPGSAPPRGAEKPGSSGTESNSGQPVTNSVPASQTQPAPQPGRVAFSPSASALSTYLASAAMLLLRVVFTLPVPLRSWLMSATMKGATQIQTRGASSSMIVCAS
jgi:hypothetical protein